MIVSLPGHKRAPGLTSGGLAQTQSPNTEHLYPRSPGIMELQPGRWTIQRWRKTSPKEVSSEELGLLQTLFACNVLDLSMHVAALMVDEEEDATKPTHKLVGASAAANVQGTQVISMTVDQALLMQQQLNLALQSAGSTKQGTILLEIPPNDSGSSTLTTLDKLNSTQDKPTTVVVQESQMQAFKAGAQTMEVKDAPKQRTEKRKALAGSEEATIKKKKQSQKHAWARQKIWERHSIPCQHCQALILYHCYCQVPYLAMDKVQLLKVCRHASAQLGWKETRDVQSLDHWALIALLISFFNTPCVPNGILNDASNWEVPAPTQGAGTSTSPLAALTFEWTLDDSTTKCKAHQAALRARVNVWRLLGTLPMAKAKPLTFAKAIEAVKRKGSWVPLPIPPHPKVIIPSPSSPSGKISGITPLSLRCQSLDPQRQGFTGIGHLALLFAWNTFNNRAHQLQHTSEHTEKVNPGLLYRWLCSLWFVYKDNPNHNKLCREWYFAD